MKHKIDDFLLGKLNEADNAAFIEAMKGSDELREEVDLSREIIEAIKEHDVMHLRSSIQGIMDNASTITPQSEASAIFDLANNLKDADLLKDNALNKTDNSLQVIHLDNHQKHIKERIHIVNQADLNDLSIDKNDDLLWNEIGESISETDVIELRHNLQQISNSLNSINDYEIDQYLDKDIEQTRLEELVNEIKSNNTLAAQVKLHTEIDQAISEKDIFELRNNLENIIDTEQSIEIKELDKIDDYLIGYLSETDEDEFAAEISDNKQLRAEIDLNKEINEAIMEEEVFALRSTLNEISQENSEEKSNVRQLIPYSLKEKPARFIGAAASIAAVVSIGALSLSQHNQTVDKLYLQAYKPYEATGLYRSSIGTENLAMKGVDLYNSKKYPEALSAFRKVLDENSEHPMCNFYSGLCLQELQKYQNAIDAFQAVINENDNLFIEQAEWYQALSMLKNNQETKAYQALNKIKNKNGYYSRNAKIVLKKLK